MNCKTCDNGLRPEEEEAELCLYCAEEYEAEERADNMREMNKDEWTRKGSRRSWTETIWNNNHNDIIFEQEWNPFRCSKRNDTDESWWCIWSIPRGSEVG